MVRGDWQFRNQFALAEELRILAIFALGLYWPLALTMIVGSVHFSFDLSHPGASMDVATQLIIAVFFAGLPFAHVLSCRAAYGELVSANSLSPSLEEQRNSILETLDASNPLKCLVIPRVLRRADIERDSEPQTPYSSEERRLLRKYIGKRISIVLWSLAIVILAWFLTVGVIFVYIDLSDPSYAETSDQDATIVSALFLSLIAQTLAPFFVITSSVYRIVRLLRR